MNVQTALARALTDSADRMVEADPPLSDLQRQCGGELPGTVAVPALLDLVRKVRRYGLRLARSITAQGEANDIRAWIEVEPRDDGIAGCAITVRNWQSTPLLPEDADLAHDRRITIDRDLAELSARLDAAQNILAVEAEAKDLAELAAAMREGAGRPWTDFVVLEDGAEHVQPLHWRLLDGVRLRAQGSSRLWRASLIPLQNPAERPHGFELYLNSDEPPPALAPRTPPASAPARPEAMALVGREIAPILRQPIASIIANAETIRLRLAGPLDEENAGYAADIVSAGQHLLGLLEDLADLEVVEAETFTTAPDHIDLAVVARQAAGILGVRARERRIELVAPGDGESLPAIGEFRRVLQILINLIGNAIRYSGPDTRIDLKLEQGGARARITVADQGPGLAPDDQARVFEKFERLGRSGDGGSGLGLYISSRLASAMGGTLSVASVPGEGASFTLDLPADMTAGTPDQRLSTGT